LPESVAAAGWRGKRVEQPASNTIASKEIASKDEESIEATSRAARGCPERRCIEKPPDQTARTRILTRSRGGSDSFR
jgi:hypothetical protein